MKLLLDEMIPGRIADQLRSSSRDCIAVSEDVALRGLEDAEVFAFAQSEGRVVVTYDRDDYLELHREYVRDARTHEGLVIVNPNRFPPAQTARLAKALRRLVDSFPSQPSFVAWLQG